MPGGHSADGVIPPPVPFCTSEQTSARLKRVPALPVDSTRRRRVQTAKQYSTGTGCWLTLGRARADILWQKLRFRG